MTKIYNVGDKVWYARSGREEVNHTCPVCYGKLVVTLVLGNDEMIKLPCDYCGKGYESPKGYVVEYEWVSKPELLTIEAVNIKREARGDEVDYRSDRWVLYPDRIFDTEEESLSKCEELSAKNTKDQEEIAIHVKANTNKTYSWKAGYHMRAVKQAEKDIASHSKMATICKERARK